MKKLKFKQVVEDSNNVYREMDSIFKNIMSSYSVDGSVEMYEFDCDKIANSILYSGNNLLHVKYFPNDSNIKLSFKIFGDNEYKLKGIKKDLKSGLEKLI